MARKVFVSSDMSNDERLIDVAEHNPQAALIWPWLLTAFDDWGRAVAAPKRIKASMFPMIDTITPEIINESIQLYAKFGLIVLYEVNGKQYMSIPHDKWFKYQTHIRGSKRDKDESKHPSPDNNAQMRANARGVAESSEDARENTPSPSLSPSLSSSKMDGLIAHEIPENFYQAHKRVFGFECNPLQAQKLIVFIEQDGLEEPVIIRALERAAINGKSGYNFNLITGILDNYFKSGVKTVEQAEKLDAAHDANRSQAPPNPYLNKNQQRRNTAAELRRQAREERQSEQV